MARAVYITTTYLPVHRYLCSVELRSTGKFTVLSYKNSGAMVKYSWLFFVLNGAHRCWLIYAMVARKGAKMLLERADNAKGQNYNGRIRVGAFISSPFRVVGRPCRIQKTPQAFWCLFDISCSTGERGHPDRFEGR